MKQIVALATAAILTLGMTGCGAPKDEAAEGKPVVTLWTGISSDSSPTQIKVHDEHMERVRAKFPQYEIVEVQMQNGSEYRQAYDKALMAGNAPSFNTFLPTNDVPGRIENGSVADITEYVENWDLMKEGKIYDKFDGALSKDGKWYGLPYEGYVQGTMVNRKALKEGGGDPENLPTTWEEFSEIGSKVTDFSVPRIGYDLLGSEWTAWLLTAWTWSAGGEMVRQREDGKYTLTFMEDPAVDAAMYFNQMIWKDKMVQKNVLQSYVDMNNDIIAGRAVFSWASPALFNANDMGTYGLSYDDFAVMPLPVKDESIKRPALTNGDALTFNPKLSKRDMDAAWDVATYMYFDEEECMAQWKASAEGGELDLMIPGRIDLVDKKMEVQPAIPERLKKELAELSEYGIAEPYCPNWAEVKNALINPLQKIYLTENISREEAKELLTDCADDLYEQYPDTFVK